MSDLKSGSGNIDHICENDVEISIVKGLKNNKKDKNFSELWVMYSNQDAMIVPLEDLNKVLEKIGRKIVNI